MRRLVWFSCGAASAVAARLATQQYTNVEVLYCNTLATEHPDNARFLNDVQQWIGTDIKLLSSTKYRTVDEVFMAVRYMAGIKGARCTVEMKKTPREAYQQETDIHIFGYTADEQKRIDKFENNNPSLFVEWILKDNNINKDRCFEILKEARIQLPAMYGLGFAHNNCIGCVKASSPSYWKMVRDNFPDVFNRRAKQSRLIGARLTRIKDENGKWKHCFLDELPFVEFEYEIEDIECGPVCQTPGDVA